MSAYPAVSLDPVHEADIDGGPLANARGQLSRIANRLSLDEATRELLGSPLREFHFSIPIQMDDGSAKEVDRLRTAANRQAMDLARRERAVEKREREVDLLRARIARHAAARSFVAGGTAMQEVLELAARVAPLDTTALVYGESATGKEFIVRLIHDQSPRATGPFVSVNCAALTETLRESDLFGHVRGSFTGGCATRPGMKELKME